MVDKTATRQRGSARTAQACSRCKEKKVRCDGRRPSCTLCSRLDVECAYAQSQRRRGPGKSKKYIENLESRLATIEDDIRRSGLPKDKTSRKEAISQDEEAGTNSSRDEISPPRSDRGSSQGPAQPMKSLFGGVDLRYWQGIVARRKDIRANTRFTKFQQQVFAPLFTGEPNRVFIGHVFGEITAPFPFLDWAGLEAKLEGDLDAYSDPARRACVNAVIATTVCFRAANSAFSELQGDAWAYFKTAFALLPQLMAQSTELEAVEAIVAMAMFLRGSPDTQNLSFLVSSASRLFQIINMRHSNPHDSIHGATGSQQQTRLIWTLCSIDQELVSRHGLSSAFDNPYKVASNLESQEILDTPMAELFRKRTSLATIQFQINEALYSNNKPHLETTQLVQEIHQLRSVLQQWSAEMHLVIPPAADESAINELETPILIHVNDLYLSHYSTILMLYWPARHLQDREGSESYGDTQFLGSLSTSKCAGAAQEALLLIGHFYSLPFMSLWSFLGYFVSAHIALFSIALARPSGVTGAGYLWAMELFVGSLELIVKENGFNISRVAAACSAMTSITRSVVKPAGTNCSADQAKAALDLLNRATSPMYIAQNWMSNVKNKEYDTSVALARVLEIPWDLTQRYGPLVPESLMPGTYAFGFEESKGHAMYRGT